MLTFLGAFAIALASSSPQVAIDPPKMEVAPFRMSPPPTMADLPTCTCPTQCEAAWAAATGSLEELSGTRIRIATPSLLETYTPTGAGLFEGHVTRQPLGNGAYAVHTSFLPWAPGQSTEASRRLALFNDRVRAAVLAETCPS
jgi:hypothetical protein